MIDGFDLFFELYAAALIYADADFSEMLLIPLVLICAILGQLLVSTKPSTDENLLFEILELKYTLVDHRFDIISLDTGVLFIVS